jgi:hypothetical protein
VDGLDAFVGDLEGLGVDGVAELGCGGEDVGEVVEAFLGVEFGFGLELGLHHAAKRWLNKYQVQILNK